MQYCILKTWDEIHTGPDEDSNPKIFGRLGW